MDETKRGPGRPKAEASIKYLPELTKEFEMGTMPDRKLIALRTKLTQLYAAKQITPEEQALMESILMRERESGSITMHDSYVLNEIENARCAHQCIVSSDNAPQVHHLRKGIICKFKYDAIKKRYYVYVPRLIPAEFQYSNELAYKLVNHLPVEGEVFPSPRHLIHRLSLRDGEFRSWFEPEDQAILAPAKDKPEEYTF